MKLNDKGFSLVEIDRGQIDYINEEVYCSIHSEDNDREYDESNEEDEVVPFL